MGKFFGIFGMLGWFLFYGVSNSWAQQSPVLILLPKFATTVGPRIFLGEIAKIKGKNTTLVERIRGLEIGKAAFQGKHRLVSRQQVEEVLNQMGFLGGQFQVVGTQTQVLTKSQRFSPDQILPQLRKFVLSKTGIASNNLKVSLPYPEKSISVPYGTIGVQFTPPVSGFYDGTVLVVVKLQVDGREFKKIPLWVRVMQEKRVVVACRRIPPGSTLTQQDVQIQKMDDEKIPQQSLSKLTGVIGKKTTVLLLPGQVLTIDSIFDPPIIVPGEIVQAEVSSAGVRLYATVKALAGGKIGDSIYVENTESHRVFHATILSPHLVTARVP
jgi:flagella basal body P-ring formation protein FlgA